MKRLNYDNLARDFVNVVCSQLTLLAHNPNDTLIHGIINSIERNAFVIKVNYTLVVMNGSPFYMESFDGESFDMKISSMDLNMIDSGICWLENYRNYMI